MPQLSTGFIIAGAYADKVRKVAFAQLRDELRRGNIDAQTIVRRTAELNRLLYDILVNRLRVDKGDVVRIRIEYEVSNRDIVWKLDTLQIEVFRRVPDDEVRKAVEETVKAAEKVLAAPPTAEEREWTGEKAAPPWRPSEDLVASAVFIGETEEGEKIAAIYNNRGEGAGIAIVRPTNGSAAVKVVLIPSTREAYLAETVVHEPVENIDEDRLKQLVVSLQYSRIDVKEAQRIIREEKDKLR